MIFSSVFRPLLLIAAIVGSATNHAQTYPNKPIRLIVPYAAGGPVDAVARLIADGTKNNLNQAMVVDNKPGAGGNLGVDLLAKSAADGYTLVMGAVATHAINPALAQRGGAKVNYNALKDFAPVALAASIANVLIVNKNFAAQQGIANFSDFMRVLKAKPGKFDMASGGTGSAGHLAGELLKSQAGVYAVHIPYGGAAPAVASVLAGQTQFMFDNLASAGFGRHYTATRRHFAGIAQRFRSGSRHGLARL
jgi:tripartite-type tricarboxylate transporter receptor subunit TctC